MNVVQLHAYETAQLLHAAGIWFSRVAEGRCSIDLAYSVVDLLLAAAAEHIDLMADPLAA